MCAGLPAAGARPAGWQDALEGGARGPAQGSGQHRPGQRAGRGALPVLRAHWSARTHCTSTHAHTHLELAPGGGRGGEPKLVS